MRVRGFLAAMSGCLVTSTKGRKGCVGEYEERGLRGKYEGS